MCSTASPDQLVDVFPNWKRLSLEKKQKRVFRDAEPALAAAVLGRDRTIPKQVRSAVQKVLREKLLTDVETLAGAREQVLGKINAIIGAGISSPAELVRVLRLAGSSGTIGAIGEAYVGARVVSESHVRNDLVLPTYTADEIPGLEGAKTFRPDRVIGDAGRTLDVKTGYANSQIDLAQARNYQRLREASIKDRSLQAKLGGALRGHDYLFLQGADPSKTSKEVAAREYERLRAKNLLNDTRVLYQAPDAKIYVYDPDSPSEGYRTIHEAMELEDE